jgi:hypothetical protein
MVHVLAIPRSYPIMGPHSAGLGPGLSPCLLVAVGYWATGYSHYGKTMVYTVCAMKHYETRSYNAHFIPNEAPFINDIISFTS